MKGLCVHTGHAGSSSYDGECAQCVAGWRANRGRDSEPPTKQPDWIPISFWAPQPHAKEMSKRTGFERTWRRAREWIARRVLMVDVAEDG